MMEIEVCTDWKGLNRIRSVFVILQWPAEGLESQWNLTLKLTSNKFEIEHLENLKEQLPFDLHAAQFYKIDVITNKQRYQM